MKFSARATIGLLVLIATAAAADERLAVLEFFGRPHGQYCSAAGPSGPPGQPAAGRPSQAGSRNRWVSTRYPSGSR